MAEHHNPEIVPITIAPSDVLVKPTGVLKSGLHKQTARESERVAAIREISTGVFGDNDAASDWLQEPNIATFDRPPLSLLDSDEGFDRLRNLLMRIDYGNLA